MHFDPSINLGNLITIGAGLIAAVFAWRDMDWRVRNLETWRREQIEGLKARAVLDERFQNAVSDFKLAIATLNTKVEDMKR
jgi:hypothetical protein